jgi:hypothetical protein
MSDPDNFIARWSRRKRAAAEDQVGEKSAMPVPDAVAKDALAAEDAHRPGNAAEACSGGTQPPELSLDLAKLPPVESITAESDIRAFLAPGVPPELTRAALRRAWSADPDIRDFIELCENSWDFNAPGAMAGFGPLQMTDELRRQVRRMVGLATDETVSPSAGLPGGQNAVPATKEIAPDTADSVEDSRRSEVKEEERNSQQEPLESHNRDSIAPRGEHRIAAQNDPMKPDNVQVTVQRLHGRALPE